MSDKETEGTDTAAPHPEEMKAEVRFRAGRFSFAGRARATPAGLIAAAILASTVLVPIVLMVKRRKSRPL